jgi:hypothetical protein
MDILMYNEKIAETRLKNRARINNRIKRRMTNENTTNTK